MRTKRTERHNNELAEIVLLNEEEVVRFVQDSIDNEKWKRNADKNGSATTLSFKVNDLVPLSTVNLPRHAVTNVGSTRIRPTYMVPFRVSYRQGNANATEMPRRMRTHPTFYVGRLRPYYQYVVSFKNGDSRHARKSPTYSCDHGINFHAYILATKSIMKFDGAGLSRVTRY